MADGEKPGSPCVSGRKGEKETFSSSQGPRGWLLRVLANEDSEFPLECSFLGGDNRIIGISLAFCKMMSDKESLEIRVIQSD